MKFEVTIIGSSSAIPAYGRYPSAQIVNYKERYFLVDCGEGTQMRLIANHIRPGRVNHIFISHLHGDHYFGLIGLVTTFNLLRRTAPLHIYAHKGIQDIIKVQLAASNTQLDYEIEYHFIDAGEEKTLYEDDEFEITTITLDHRIPCSGFLFREKKLLRHFSPEKAEKYNVPVDAIQSLKEGNDFEDAEGNVVPNLELTEDPHKIRKYAYITDTRIKPGIIAEIEGSDLLYHEATFSEEDTRRAEETFHSTSVEAAGLAKKANIERLIIGHFSGKYRDPSILLEEARAVFENTYLATEGQTFSMKRIY